MLESITKPISAMNNPYLVLKAKSELSNVQINNANVNGLRQLPGAVSVQEVCLDKVIYKSNLANNLFCFS